MSLPRCTSSWCTPRSSSSPMGQHTLTQSYSTISFSCGSRLVSYYLKIHDLFLASKLEILLINKISVLRNYLLQFPVPVPTFDKFRFLFRLYIKTLKNQFSKKFVKFFAFLMLIEAALLPRNLVICVWENFCDSILLRFRFR